MIMRANGRTVLVAAAALVAGVAVFFAARSLKEDPDRPAETTASARAPAPSPQPSVPVPGKSAARAEMAPPPVRLADGAGLSTADIALKLAAWPEGAHRADLPKWAALLAARGPEAIADISSALATAETNAGRGVLADALARIGTNDAVQELCTNAVKAPEGEPRQAIATSFRTLGRPAAVPMLATLFSEIDSGPLVREASAAICRLADYAGVEALADLAQEGGQLHSQRDTIFRVMAALENPDALPALEVIAADGTDIERADAAREGIIKLKAAAKRQQAGK
jgi:hypothetical protein